MDMAAYHLAGGAEIREGALPDRTFLNSLLEKCRFAHWQDWTVMCLRDGVGIAKMGSDGPLKWSVDSLYFEMYLFALHQREALVSFQEEINDIDKYNCNDVFVTCVQNASPFYRASSADVQPPGRESKRRACSTNLCLPEEVCGDTSSRSWHWHRARLRREEARPHRGKQEENLQGSPTWGLYVGLLSGTHAGPPS